jgi:hypothetical protein
MKHIGKSLAALTLALAAALTSACQTSSGSHAGECAIMCDKCKTVWVMKPTGAPGAKFTSYSRESQMTCSACQSAVENFAKTGELKHSCSHCKGELTCCKSH